MLRQKLKKEKRKINNTLRNVLIKLLRRLYILFIGVK